MKFSLEELEELPEVSFKPVRDAILGAAWDDDKIAKSKTSDLVMLVSSASSELKNIAVEVLQEDLDELKSDDPEEYDAFMEAVTCLKRQCLTAAAELDRRVPAGSY